MALLLSCASSERPEYLLSDGKLLTLQGGDSNTYAVLNADSTTDRLESYTEVINSKTILLPDQTTSEVLVESFEQSGGLIFPFISRIFRYDEQNNLILLGVTRGGVDYWLVDQDISDVGQIFLAADLSTFVDPLIISSPLKFCENQICETKGQIDITLEPEGTEKVETNYADFESYKLSIDWQVDLFDTENANNSVSQLLRKEGSIQWIHPAIGIVKFVYQVQHDAASATLLGNLTSTNISIPDKYKK